jgi:hypothetical protein
MSYIDDKSCSTACSCKFLCKVYTVCFFPLKRARAAHIILGTSKYNVIQRLIHENG